jgi:hypothetical protein
MDNRYLQRGMNPRSLSHPVTEQALFTRLRSLFMWVPVTVYVGPTYIVHFFLFLLSFFNFSLRWRNVVRPVLVLLITECFLRNSAVHV